MRRRRRAAGLAVAGAAFGTVALPAGAAAATFTVTNTNNSGAGSLRQAVLDGNMTTPSDTIVFAPNVTGTINLASTIVVTRSTIIDGPGAGTLKVVNPTGNAFFQNDTLPSGIDVEFEGLTVEGHSTGPGSGGGGFVIGSGSSATIRNCVISGGTAANQGGGIFVENTPLSVIGSTLTGNMAGTRGGAIYGRDAAVAVVGSTLSGNKALSGGGIAIGDSASPTPSSLALTDSKLTGNQATGFGGGIAIASADGPTTIVRSTVSGSLAGDGGGGLYFGYGDSLTIDSSTFSTNSVSGVGAGIEIYAPSGPTSISDSTIAGNTALGNGAGIYSFGYFDKPVSIANSTIASNVSTSRGGGIFRFGYDGAGVGYEGPDEISLASTVVANNLSGAGGDLADGLIADGSFRAANSLVGSTAGAAVTESAPGTNNLNAGAIPLAPLADNGGPDPDDAPADGQPGDRCRRGERPRRPISAECLVTVRQPGTSGGDGTDIGAAELGDVTVNGAKLTIKKKQKVKGRKVVIAVEAGADEAVMISATGTVKLGKKKLALSKPTADVAAGETAKLKLKPASKKSLRKILKVIGSGKKAKATVSVEFADGAGNAETLPAKVKLSAKGSKR